MEATGTRWQIGLEEALEILKKEDLDSEILKECYRERISEVKKNIERSSEALITLYAQERFISVYQSLFPGEISGMVGRYVQDTQELQKLNCGYSYLRGMEICHLASARDKQALHCESQEDVLNHTPLYKTPMYVHTLERMNQDAASFFHFLSSSSQEYLMLLQETFLITKSEYNDLFSMYFLLSGYEDAVPLLNGPENKDFSEQLYEILSI